MVGFDPDFHKCILFEEFKIDFYPINMLKWLLEGSEYAFLVKCEADIVFKFRGPILVMTNWLQRIVL